ncbi:hypothetical protein A54_107 [Septuagintavirus sv54]|uniref:Uncharacterized protein n=1 Tax=Escherichia phage A5-4 TaxID=2996162 RepID=A0AAE9TIQ9_9CAUD|nr:hypothetical protein A54_107 [Escherichia phage A5-4]
MFASFLFSALALLPGMATVGEGEGVRCFQNIQEVKHYLHLFSIHNTSLIRLVKKNVVLLQQ